MYRFCFAPYHETISENAQGAVIQNGLIDYGGGFSETGRPNELWSFGEEVYSILKKYLDNRLRMKEYIKSVMDEASANGSPVIRTMFYEFPEDEACWNIDDQYMFGPKYLVAPVMYQGMTQSHIFAAWQLA